MSTLTAKLPKIELPKIDLTSLNNTLSSTEATKPFYAVVGVADLAVEQLKEVPSDLSAQATSLQTRVQTELQKLPAQAQAQLKTLPGQLNTRVSSLQKDATDTYTGLVQRGEKLVGQIRRQPSTVEAEKQVKATQTRAKATSTTAKKAATATSKATTDAAHKVG